MTKMTTWKVRLQTKVDLLVGREKGMITVDDVFELADELGHEITKREAEKMIRKGCDAYGY